MENKSNSEVASFLIRFIQNHSNTDNNHTYRGIIQHIQTEKEIFFTCWGEAETFIQQVVPLENIKEIMKELNDEIER